MAFYNFSQETQRQIVALTNIMHLCEQDVVAYAIRHLHERKAQESPGAGLEGADLPTSKQRKRAGPLEEG